MTGRILLLVLAGSISTARIGGAQERIAIAPYLGAHFSDHDRFLLSESENIENVIDDGPIAGVRVAIPVLEAWSAELSYGWTPFEVRHLARTIELPEPIAQESYDLHLLELGVRWTASKSRPVTPFATLGAGIAIVTFEAELLGMDIGVHERETETALVAGGGFVWHVNETLGLRGDLRDHVRFCDVICGEDETLHELELSGGVEIYP